MIFDSSEYIIRQEQLDANINKIHDVDYLSTRGKRIVALLVEVGELANATRVFKFWSNKEGESTERIIDEFVDAMHFFLSLGIDLNIKKRIYDVEEPSFTSSEQILRLFQAIIDFSLKLDEDSYCQAFNLLLQLGLILGFDAGAIECAYLKKLHVNYQRQIENY